LTPFSIAILTRNEERALAGCLESVSWAEDVAVFDSMSDDGTRDVAKAFGRPFYEHPFRDYAAQRMTCLATVPFRNDWVFFLDADERFTPELRDEIQRSLAAAPPDLALMRVRRKDFFMGRWIRRTSGYPTWFGRLVRRGRVTVSRPINERYEADGTVGLLMEHVIHYPFINGIERWIERHNRYSSMEAAQLEQERGVGPAWRDFFAADPERRRRALKTLAYRLPARPLVAFLYLYVFRLGFLEGRAGLEYARLRATYERMIDVKRLELRRRAADSGP
jgi:glycosyltransferase involved in cell wall biosynthesis